MPSACARRQTTSRAIAHTTSRTIAAAAAAIALVMAASLGGWHDAAAHPIDEVRANVLISFVTTDRRGFEVTAAFPERHLERFYEMAAELGMTVSRGREAFARVARGAFAFPGCALEDVPSSERFPAATAGGGTRGHLIIRYRLVCEAPMVQLTLTRLDYRRDRTRTTLFVAMRVGESLPARYVLPPHLRELTLPVLGDLPTQPPRVPAAGDTLATRSAIPNYAFGGPGPGADLDSGDFPPVGAAADGWRWRPPPRQLLRAWGEEGARHLAFGWDHLLFLVALAIGARRLSRLWLAVLSFSLGHIASMAVTFVLDWPQMAVVEVIIGLSISAAGLRARSPKRWRTGHLALFAAAFGLVHGMGFGAGLKAMVGASDALIWPLASFGVGLDVAQVCWVSLIFVAWGRVRRKRLAWPPSARATAVQRGAASLLVVAGLVAALLAARAI